MKIKQRQKEYWKRRIKMHYNPVQDANKKLELELRVEDLNENKPKNRNFNRISLEDLRKSEMYPYVSMDGK